MDRGAWRGAVHEVAKSRTGLKRLSVQTHQPCVKMYIIVLSQDLLIPSPGIYI